MQPTPVLKRLLMDAKPLGELMPNEDRWNKLAARLKQTFPALPKSSPNANEAIHLCAAYYAHGQEPLISSYAYSYAARFNSATFDELARETAGFLKDFMDFRGQWEYIQRQPWYTSRDYVIGIDVNYYPDRSGSQYTMSPLFHKDTGGNNLFVNLIFDNKQPIESTEWFVDVAEPSGKRAAWQDKVLPPEHLEELHTLRRELRGSGAYRVPVVNGGVLKGNNVFVSWVDDLVWHATPSLNQRIVCTAADAVAMYPSLKDSLWGGKVFTFAGTSGNVSIHPVELLATMAENQDTNLFRWLASRDLQVQDLDFEQARLAWVLLYGNAGGQARFTSDAQQRGRVEWRMIGQVADAIAPDTRLAQGPNTGPHVTETPPGLSMVRRVNSGDLGVKEVAAQNQGVPRSFVRTWVRILSKNSNELKLKGFVVK